MTNSTATMRYTESAEWTLPSRGRVGVISLICTEASLFTIFVVAYLFYIGKSLSGPSPGQVLGIPIRSTICLLSSSVTIMLAERALRQGLTSRFNLWWFLTILLGAEFLRATAVEWYRLISADNLTIATNLFGTTFYSLVGLHTSHVIVGLLLLTLVFILSARGYVTQAQSERVEALSWYWHFVDIVWVVVFTVVYIIGR